MEVVQFSQIRDEIISNMRREMLIPFIGSGFTRNCSSIRGQVPSGKDFCTYMISKISEAMRLPEADKEKISTESFSSISEIYHFSVPTNEQETYLKNNFTKVELEKNKVDLLSLSWPYIYTLNIDDAIENSSEYDHVIYANRPYNERIFDDEKCVIKLHGDVSDMLTYTDSGCEIFTQKQYVDSLKKNAPLLSKLKHDGIYQNLIFIGCSLDDEIDLLASLMPMDENASKTAKYICVTQPPSVLDRIKYQKYGITHCVIFSSYDDIYNELYSAGLVAQSISTDDLENYRSFAFKKLTSSYEENKPYLLFGKSLLNKDHTITLPYYFISRKESSEISSNIDTYYLQLLIGGRCSGKSYILADLACKIRNKDVFLFETKDRLSDRAFEALLSKNNSVILADSAALSRDQFEYLIDNIEILKAHGINVIIAVNKNDRELNGILKLHELQGRIMPGGIPQIQINNFFSQHELSQINPLLTAIDAGIFSAHKTIVDNIIEISEKLTEKNKYQRVSPNTHSIQEIVSLIALGIEKKIYSSRATRLDIHEELLLQCKAAEPLIDYESTWSFEKGYGDNSPVKYVLNAEYWLCNQLEKFARNESTHKLIVEAFKTVISKIIANEGKPDILFGNNRASYKDYIYFDNINLLFASSGSSSRNGISLIRVIYEGLNDLLSVDPNYMHQRSKCYIKSSYYAQDPKLKIEYLDKAYRDANVARQVFSHRYDEFGNEKLIISIDHIAYTQALILCHKCNIASYADVDANTNAIRLLHQALTSPYNSYSFAKTDSFNYQNVVGQIIHKTLTNKTLVHSEVYALLQELFTLISESS